MNEHYESLTFFLEQKHTRRITALLKPNKKSKRKFYVELSKSLIFQNKYVFKIPNDLQTSKNICAFLTKAGAPTECYVITDDRKISDKIMELHRALEHVLGQGIGAFISCIPEKLGYFESGDQGERFVLINKE